MKMPEKIPTMMLSFLDDNAHSEDNEPASEDVQDNSSNDDVQKLF